MKDYIKKQAIRYYNNINAQFINTDYTDGFTSASDLMPRLLEFYADNFRHTDQDFDKVVKMYFEKLNKQQ